MQTLFLLLFSLPVLAAQYFSLDLNPANLLSAVLSLCALVVFLSLVLARLRPGMVRTAVGLTTTTTLALYFFGQFLSFYLQGSYINQQFYFHMNLATLTETWSAYWPLAALFGVWLALLWSCFLWFRNRLDTLRPAPALLTLLLIAALALDPGLRQTAIASLSNTDSDHPTSLSEVDWNRLKLNKAALDASIAPVSAGKNLVLVFMEGLEKLYTEESIFPELTPNLTRFGNEGWQLDNVFQIPGSEWTMGGLVATLCGTPLLHDLGLDGNVVMFTGFLNQATCVPDLLARAGYRQTFMGGASLEFAGKGEFLEAHNFDTALGREELAPRLANPDRLGGWGLFDESLFDLATGEFERLAATGSPFNLTLLTVDTHHPSGEPSPGCPPYEQIDNSILHAVHCTDLLVGKFVNFMQHHPAWQDTVVVLVSDHLGMRNNAYSLFPDYYERRLYFTALNTGHQEQRQVIATPMDLAPTILDLLSVQQQASFLAGSSLLNAENLQAEDAGIEADRSEAARYINSNYFSSRNNEQLLYSLATSRLFELDFSDDVSEQQRVNDGLLFTATGDDPFILLPELTLDEADQVRMYVTLETEQASTFTVYYPTEDEPGYSEAHTLHGTTVKGENQLVFSLDLLAVSGRLRIDPGINPGHFQISRLEIRSQ
ncbi:MAG: sulfatase-like hydrolase/transferase [Gammaproteobacteria bacterium]